MIPFSPPRLDQKTVDAVADTLRSGWITTGPKTKRFEKEITAYTGADATLCVNSCTAGMELILRWFGVGPGDEVIVPAYTYCATANVVVHCGAVPVMVDCLPGSFHMDPDQVRLAVSERTKAIIPVDFAGFPCDYDAMRAIVKDDRIRSVFQARTTEQQRLGRILILADAAHSFGAVYNGTKVGAVADVTAFSFHAVKNLTTAEGGALCLSLPPEFDPEKVYAHLNVMSLHGQSKDALAKTEKGGWKYDVVTPGYKCNMTDIQAAIGLVELERYDSETLPRRKHLAELYDRGLDKHAWAILPQNDDHYASTSSYHLYPLRIEGLDEDDRDRVIEEMTRQNVAVNVHFVPLPMLTAYRDRGYAITDFPEAYAAYRCEISLPLYYDLTEDQVIEVVQTLAEAVEAVQA